MLKARVHRELVQRILARKNLSQNWLAKRTGVSSGYMSQVMHGDRCPSPKVRVRLQKALGVNNFDALFEIVE